MANRSATAVSKCVTAAVSAWLGAGVIGAIVFWLVQVVMGSGTITQFMGEQITSAGGYPAQIRLPIGWAVHFGVSLAYSGLFGILAMMVTRVGGRAQAILTLVLALVLGWLTAVIAPPAISVTIALLAARGWPEELFPLNTSLGLPLYNHLLFFVLCWLAYGLIASRACDQGARAPS